jgi:glycosyltransferase involved in cell wall biosynthesis
MEKKYIEGLVSVVITTYNHVDFIDETIESIIAQSYKNLEILICDDCSSDGTTEKIKLWANKDTRIITLLASQNEGLSKNVNKGFDKASGEFLALMGGDDKMAPCKIEKQVDFLNKNREVDVVLHWVEIFDSIDRKSMGVINSNVLETPDDWFAPFTFFGFKKNNKSTFPPTSYLARSTYSLRSRYDERLKYKNEILFAIDNYMKDRNAKWYCIPEVLGFYRMHENNMHRTPGMQNALLEETYVNSAIASARYPSIAQKMKNVVIHFLYNNLFYLYLDAEKRDYDAINEAKARLKSEAGALNLWLALILIRARILYKKIRN